MEDPEPNHSKVLDEFELSQIERRWRVARLAWALILVAPIAFAVVANAIGHDTDTGEATYLVRYVLSVMSAVVLALAFFLRRAAANPRSVIHRFMASYLACIIVAGSLCASVGIYGLAVFAVEGSYAWMYLFEAFSAVALIVLRPRKQDLVNLAAHSKREH